MKLLHIHAHHDDFEWAAAGTFERWRQQLGDDFHARIVVCTDGRAGHHFRTREETGALRRREQEAAAGLAEVEYVQLVDHRGEQFREACVELNPAFLGALWKAIRDFQPDYLFCPPVPADPLAGVHPDHLSVAEGVRRVAYMINVPHAFTPEYPADETRSEPCKVPVILNVHDGYMTGAKAFDLAIDIAPVFEHLVAVTWCHQSQFCEWLPWVDRHNLRAPASQSEWADQLCAAHARRNEEMGMSASPAAEFFRVTAWGRVPTAKELLADFPALIDPPATLRRLQQRLERWSAA
jgi:LmbE family N-acetylglucosaminyl deacetylase